MTRDDFFMIVRFVIWGSLFAVVCIPLVASTGSYFPTTAFPFLFGKNIVFRFLVEVAVVSWTVLAIYIPEYRPKKSWILGSVTFFLFVIAIANIFGENPFKSFWGTFERMEGWVTLLHLGLYTLVAGVMLHTEKFWYTFFQSSLGISAFLSLMALVQEKATNTVVQSSRVDATFGNPAYLATYLVVHIFIVLWLLVRAWSSQRKKAPWLSTWLWYVPIMSVQIVALFKTATRGPLIGLIGGIFVGVVLIALFERANKWVRMISIGIIVAVMLIIGGFISIRNSQFVQQNFFLQRLANISLSDDTTASRIVLWNIAYQGFLEHPVLGWGQENFNYVFNKYYDQKLYKQEPWFDRAHTIVFEWLVAGGVLGLMSYLLLFIVSVAVLWMKTPLSFREKSILTGLFVGYFIENLFLFDTITSYILFFTFIAYLYHLSTRDIPFSTAKVSLWSAYGGMSLVFISIGILFYVSVVVPFTGSRYLIQAFYTPIESASIKLNLFKNALASGTIGRSEIREKLFTSAVEIHQSNISTEIKKEYVAYTREQATLEGTENPNDVKSQLLSGMFFQQLGEYTTAQEYLMRAKELSPYKPQVRIAIAINLLRQNDIPAARAEIEEMYMLNPSNELIRKLYAIIAYAAQDLATVDELYPGDDVVMDSQFLNMYRERKQYDKMLQYLKKDIEIKGENVKTLIALALGYWAAGDQAGSLQVFDQAYLKATTDADRDKIDSYRRDVKAGKIPRFK